MTTPLAGAALLLVGSRWSAAAIRWVAAIAAALGFLAAVPLWFRYDPLGPPWQLTERAALVPAIGASYVVGVDGYSVLLVQMTTAIGVVAVLSSWSAITERVRAHYVCLLLLQTAILGAFIALDALLFFGFWCLTLAAVSLLIGIWGTGRRHRSAIRFLIYSLTGSAGLLIAILGLYFNAHEATGIYSFDITRLQGLTLPAAHQRWIFVAFFVAFAFQAAMVPFHGWLRDAQADAPTAAAVVVSAVLLKMGTYGFVRFSLPILPEASRAFIPWVAGLSLIAIVGGALWAVVQTDWKRLLACLSISQMGLVTLGLFAITPAALSGSLLQSIGHGISMGALVLMAGLVHQRRGTSSTTALRGLSAPMPAFAVVFLVMALASIGLPGLSGFAGESMIVRGVAVAHRFWAAAAASGLVLGAVSMLWRYRRLAFDHTVQPADAARHDLTVREIVMLAPLAALAAWIGLYPAPFLARIEPTMARVITRLEPGYAPAYATVPGCGGPGSTAAPAPSAPAGFTAIAPCDDPSAAGKR